ncbi:MAG: metallophosphatase, partial [Bacteroidia bacterium]|nr:metallophosphatase [Bacteroidia bacterium]
HNPVNRRNFIRNSALTAGAITIAGAGVSANILSIPLKTDEETPQLKLSYNLERKFKIVQFTDIHWKAQVSESKEAADCMNYVLDEEKPDLVFYTGDHVTGEPVAKGIDAVFEPVVSRKIPFAMVLGNHDDEFSMSRREIFDYVGKLPGNLTGTVGGITGMTNFTIPLYQSTSERIMTVLYGFDSNRGPVEADQVAWYTQKSKEYTLKNKGIPVPSLAFFHIPLPEFKEAIIDLDARFYGIRKEQVACPAQNTGLFSAFKENGDVMAVFVGHDHLNDYVVCWKEIMLCYGRITGSKKTSHYNLPDGSNGARVIELTEGERGFDSWIRRRTGEKIKPFSYPFDFIDK